MENSASLRGFAGSVPLLRGLTHQVSPYHTGSVLENRLGLQIFRMLGKNVAWHLRKDHVTADVKKYLEVMMRDGLLVIPNFLPAESFAEIRQDFEKVQSSLQFSSFRSAAKGKLHVAKLELSERGTDFSSIRRHLQGHPMILGLAEAVIRRPITSAPAAAINIYRRVDYTAADNDLENILHCDLHTPTVKAFYYLNRVDETNGAFVYAKGSHKLTISRLRHEYDLSVRTAKLTRGDQDIPKNLLATRGALERNIISERSRRLMNIQESSVCGDANTLIIANNMGFHRRGEFTSDQPRETIQLNFRHLEHSF